MAIDPNHPLREGVVGRQIVAYFEKLDGRVAVDAESLGSQAEGQQDYLITFEGGLQLAYRVTFSSINIFVSDIVDATPLN